MNFNVAHPTVLMTKKKKKKKKKKRKKQWNRGLGNIKKKLSDGRLNSN